MKCECCGDSRESMRYKKEGCACDINQCEGCDGKVILKELEDLHWELEDSMIHYIEDFDLTSALLKITSAIVEINRRIERR